MIHAVQVPYDHIRYTRSSVKSFSDFWELVENYERMYNTVLPVNAMISLEIRETLVATDRRRLEGNFYSLSRTDLYDLMQSQFRPVDRIEFMQKLEDNVEFVFSAHKRPSPEYFKPFYDALLVFCTRFSRIHDILIQRVRNDSSILPRVDNKPGGLIKAFLTKIPFEYGTRVYLLMDIQSWESLNSFIKAFRNIADEHKAHSELTRKLRRCFGGTQYESKRLQHLQELRAFVPDPSIYDDEWYETVASELADLPDPDEDLTVLLATAMQQPRARDPSKKLPYDKTAPRDPLVCITKLLHGTCTKSPCAYSHDKDLVMKKRYEIKEMIEKQIALSKAGGAQRAYPPQKVAALEEHSDDEDY
jgi:hypothetical protein